MLAWKRIAIALLFVLAVYPLCVQAQEGAVKGATQLTVYGGYSWLSNSFNNHSTYSSGSSMNGWDADAALPVMSHIDLKVEGLGFYDNNLGDPERAHYLLAGPTLRHGIGREVVFVQGLAGIGHINSAALNLGGEGPRRTTSFATDLGGGIDFPVAPRVAWRVQGGWLFSAFSSQSNQISGLPRWFGRLSTGIVAHF